MSAEVRTVKPIGVGVCGRTKGDTPFFMGILVLEVWKGGMIVLYLIVVKCEIVAIKFYEAKIIFHRLNSR